MKTDNYILGVDGGGTSTRCCIFNDKGFTLAELIVEGSNLSFYKRLGIKRIIDLIQNTSSEAGINLSEISAFGFGLAGISDLKQRELFIKELDRLNISPRSLILSDTEAAFKLLLV